MCNDNCPICQALITDLKAKNDRLEGINVQMAEEIADLEAQLALCQWVSVEERLPDDETEVLVMSEVDNDYEVNQMDLYDGKWRNVCGQEVDGWPTHWMPIPTLPESEVSNG
jgi:hypothetical protein